MFSRSELDDFFGIVLWCCIVCKSVFLTICKVATLPPPQNDKNFGHCHSSLSVPTDQGNCGLWWKSDFFQSGKTGGSIRRETSHRKKSAEKKVLRTFQLLLAPKSVEEKMYNSSKSAPTNAKCKIQVLNFHLGFWGGGNLSPQKLKILDMQRERRALVSIGAALHQRMSIIWLTNSAGEGGGAVHEKDDGKMTQFAALLVWSSAT